MTDENKIQNDLLDIIIHCIWGNKNSKFSLKTKTDVKTNEMNENVVWASKSEWGKVLD